MTAIDDRHALNVEREGHNLFNRMSDRTSELLAEGRMDEARESFLQSSALLQAPTAGRTSEIAHMLDAENSR